MDLEQALLWYAQGRFTADDVTRATGLSERSQRELLKLGILRPIPQARTKTRLLDGRMLKRAAVIAPLNKLGFSLQVAGRIVYAAPLLEDLIFPIVDPWSAIFDLFSDPDPKTSLPQRRTSPHGREGWFDPGTPAVAEGLDYLIKIVDCQFVGYTVEGETQYYGELSDDLTEFHWRSDATWSWMKQRGTPEEKLLSPAGASDETIYPEMLRFIIKQVSASDNQKEASAWHNPVTTVLVNASLALRRALRRLLYID